MIIPRKHSYGVRIYKAGIGQRWVGSFAFKDHGGKREALKLAREAESKALAFRAKRTILLGKYVDGYLDDYAKANKGSSYSHARAALKTLKNDFGHLPLSDDGMESIRPEDWAREHPSCVPSVVTFFNRAVSRREIALTYNPFAGLSHKSRGRKDKVPLSTEEVDALAQEALEHHREYGPMMRSLILFAAHSALRPGELFALEWPDIDFENRRVKVERRVYRGSLALPKNNRPRAVVLTPQARDALLPLDRSTEHVFESKTGKRLSQSSLSGYWGAVSRNFGERPDKNGVHALVDFYELRHRCAYWMYVEFGMPDRVVAAQLGHTDGGKLIRDLYGHGDHGALEEIDRVFADNVTPLREVKSA